MAAGDDTRFLPLESVVDTMLHELAHNVHGPHDQHFHALWDKLRDEHQALVMKGYTGEGFLGQGNRLGGRRMPLNEARRKARAAAERRKTLQAGSGQRLGGSGIMRGQDPRAVIAAAVERRQRIERGCASNTDKGRQLEREEVNKKNVTRTTVDHEDEDEATMMQAYIDLIQEDEQNQLGDLYIPSSQENPAGSKSLPREHPGKLLQRQREIEDGIRKQTQTPPQPSALPQPKARPKEPSPPPASDTWTCEICTLVNPINYLSCDACTVERPAHISAQIPSDTPFPPPRSHHHPTTSRSSNPDNHRDRDRDRERPAAFAPRHNAYDNLKRFEQQSQTKRDTKPLGWTCHGCGNFMELEWWTCSVCGVMKASS